MHRLNTDMVFGNRGGVSTMVVLTGVTPLQALEEHSYSKEEKPTYYLESVAKLFG